MRVNRRQALAALSGLAVAGLTGCGGSPLRVAVVWSDWELRRFREVVDHRETLRDLDVVVYSAGDDIATLLKNSTVASAAPDVAIVPRPGLLRDPAVRDRLQTVPSTDPRPWRDLVRPKDVDPSAPEAGNPPKGIWCKVSHKSLLWHRRGAVPPPSTDWKEWMEQCRALAGRGTPPLSIGAADGWTLTSWFENVLLGVDEATYRRLHRDPGAWSHPSVLEALTRLAELWHIENLLPGGARRALTTQFHDAILDVFYHRRAAMVAAPDLAWSVVGRYCPSERPESTRFPWPGGGRPPVLVGGDVAVALTSSGERGRRFMEWLTEPDAGRQMARWAAQGGFLSLRPDVRGYPAPLRALAAELHSPSDPAVPGDPIAFGLSDQLTGALAGGDGRGLWRVLTELFIRTAGDREKPDQAAGHAVETLKALAETVRPA